MYKMWMKEGKNNEQKSYPHSEKMGSQVINKDAH